MIQPERFEQGWKKLQEIHGTAGEQAIESLQSIAPDLAKYIIEFAFGDIYSRSGLDLKSRQIATVAALTALGNAQPQLKVRCCTIENDLSQTRNLLVLQVVKQQSHRVTQHLD